MAKTTKSEDVPKEMLEKFNAITALTDEFSKLHLNDEYAQMIRFATAALCRKRRLHSRAVKAKPGLAV